MAIETREQTAAQPDDEGKTSEGYIRPVEYLGRSVRVVGPQKSPDPRDDPHAKNRRGELGGPLFNWYFNTVSRDPLSRMGFNTHSDNPPALLGYVVGRSPRGAVNQAQTPAADPAAMTRHIKQVALALGASAVGIARTDPAYIYSGGARRREDDSFEGEGGGAGETPDEVARRFPYAICMLQAWDYEMGRAHRHRIGDAAYFFSSSRNQLVQAQMAGYLRELGYGARQGAANTMPMALLAGLGEIGRLGIVISEKYGARVHPSVILTDLPLVPDKPIDIGVSDFCNTCKKCATNCPTNSINHDEKKVINGVEKWAINWKTCYAFRPYWSHIWQICLTCVTVCPYTKPNVWWRTLAVESLKRTPIPLRPLLVRALLAVDNRVWGETPKERVQWIGQDSGRQPGDEGCTVTGCSCKSGEDLGNVGFYAPLKENARRFHRK